MNLLFIGDIVGRPGREAVARSLPHLRERYQIGFTIANGENAAGGLGITAAVAEELLQAGIDAVTTGNHVWRHRQAIPYLEDEPRVLRPANFPPGAPGRGSGLFPAADAGPVGVVNLVGRTFMDPLDCPFRAADREIQELRGKTKLIIADVHAEATSEKLALGWYLDGRVSAVIGTHTHVQTADERLLPQGTAYITDVGMTGPRDSILGVKEGPIIQRFLTGLPTKFEVAAGPLALNAVAVNLDTETGTATSIERVIEFVQPEE